MIDSDAETMYREASPEPADANRAAGEEVDTQKALVIGIGTYGRQFMSLENAPGDAQAVADLLKNDFAFELIPNGSALLEAEANLHVIKRLIRESLEEAGSSARWLFYFAGHGLMWGGTGFLLPADAVWNEPDTFLQLSWLLQSCLKSYSGEILIILDACYAGQALVSPRDLTDLIPIGETGKFVRQIITSGNPDQPVLDGGGTGHSIFTQALIEALEGWAGIHRQDGSIAFTPLLDYLANEVPKRQATLNQHRVTQQPVGGYFSGNRFKRDFIFKPKAHRLSPEVVQGMGSAKPERRIESLAHLLAEMHQDEARRSPAIELAKKHLNPTFENDVAVRVQAARTLGDLGDTRAVEDLIVALEDEADVVRSAAQALGRLTDHRATGPLLAKLKTTNDDLLLDLITALGMLDAREHLLDGLRVCLSQHRLVPIVGPDFPLELTGLPDRAHLAREIAKRSGLTETDSLAKAIDGSRHGGSSVQIAVAYLRRTLNDQLIQPGRIYQSLSRLDASLWISCTYDSLLVKELNAISVVNGDDINYIMDEQPVVVRLFGDLISLQGLVLLESDYKAIGRNEDDRQKMLSFLKEKLEGQVILFLGFDPDNPDFALLVKHLMDGHLVDIRISSFLVARNKLNPLRWAGGFILPIQDDPAHFVQALAANERVEKTENNRE